MFSQPRIIKMKFWIEYNREVKYVKKNFCALYSHVYLLEKKMQKFPNVCKVGILEN